MPTVGKAHFKYTPQGIAEAKAFSEMTGDSIQMEKKYKEGGTPEKSPKEDNQLKDIAKWRELMSSSSPIDAEMMQTYLNRWLKSTGQDTLVVDKMFGPKTIQAMDKAKEAYGGKKYEFGGEILEGRRMYGTNPKKKKYPMQTADIGPVRGYENGGEVKTPSYKKLSNEDLKQMAIDGDSKAKNTLYKRLRRKEVGKSALKWGLGSAGLLKGLDVLNQKHGPEYGKSNSPLNLLSLVIPGLMGAGFGALKGLGHEKVYEKYRDVEPKTPITLKEAKSFKKGGKVKYHV